MRMRFPAVCVGLMLTGTAAGADPVDTAHDIGHTFHKVGRTVEHGAKDVGQKVENGARTFGRSVVEGWHSFRRGLTGD